MDRYFTKIVKDYNNCKHRPIGLKPIEVDISNEKDILQDVFKYNPPNIITTSNIKIENRVRISNKKNTFSNKYKNNWSGEIFIIYKANNTNPITYGIKEFNNEEIQGSFHELELKITSF